MGVLSGKQVYISGPLQYTDTPVWSEEEKRSLETLGLIIKDPFNDPKQKWTSDLYEARDTKNFPKIREIAKRFVRKDLACVDRSDFIIAKLPYAVPTAGTVHEIIQSNEKKKPTLLICDKGKEWMPLWFYGFIPLRYMFNNFQEVLNYLREVDNKQHIEDDRWHFVYEVI